VAGSCKRLQLKRKRVDSREMDLSDFIHLGTREPALRFLIIGGYAVAAQGHVRATFDVDLLVRRADHDAWCERVQCAGLTPFQRGQVFAQFTQPQGGDGLDLMFADDQTFEPMWRASEEREFGADRARVPCLEHLIALKLHALKQALEHRTSKDAEDVEMLLRRNSVTLEEPRYRDLFLKYGNRELYETFVRLLRER